MQELTQDKHKYPIGMWSMVYMFGWCGVVKWVCDRVGKGDVWKSTKFYESCPGWVCGDQDSEVSKEGKSNEG